LEYLDVAGAFSGAGKRWNGFGDASGVAEDVDDGRQFALVGGSFLSGGDEEEGDDGQGGECQPVQHVAGMRMQCGCDLFNGSNLTKSWADATPRL